jgi:hypothetical protein
MAFMIELSVAIVLISTIVTWAAVAKALSLNRLLGRGERAS